MFFSAAKFTRQHVLTRGRYFSCVEFYNTVRTIHTHEKLDNHELGALTSSRQTA